MSYPFKPDWAIPVGEILAEYLTDRGWGVADLVAHMPGDPELNELAVLLVLHVHTPGLFLGEELAEGLAVALGRPASFWVNLDRMW